MLRLFQMSDRTFKRGSVLFLQLWVHWYFQSTWVARFMIQQGWYIWPSKQILKRGCNCTDWRTTIGARSVVIGARPFNPRLPSRTVWVIRTLLKMLHMLPLARTMTITSIQRGIGHPGVLWKGFLLRPYYLTWCTWSTSALPRIMFRHVWRSYDFGVFITNQGSPANNSWNELAWRWKRIAKTKSALLCIWSNYVEVCWPRVFHGFKIMSKTHHCAFQFGFGQQSKDLLTTEASHCFQLQLWERWLLWIGI